MRLKFRDIQSMSTTRSIQNHQSSQYKCHHQHALWSMLYRNNPTFATHPLNQREASKWILPISSVSKCLLVVNQESGRICTSWLQVEKCFLKCHQEFPSKKPTRHASNFPSSFARLEGFFFSFYDWRGLSTTKNKKASSVIEAERISAEIFSKPEFLGGYLWGYSWNFLDYPIDSKGRNLKNYTFELRLAEASQNCPWILVLISLVSINAMVSIKWSDKKHILDGSVMIGKISKLLLCILVAGFSRVGKDTKSRMECCQQETKNH